MSFSYVLEHKIEDLRRQIQPKDEAIVGLRSQIEEMEDELNAVSRTQADLELAVADSRSKTAASLGELTSERKRLGLQNAFLSRLQKDLGELEESLQKGESKTLKDAVTKLCRKHHRFIDGVGGTAKDKEALEGEEDADKDTKALQEVMRQKAFLERTIVSLREQMRKQNTNHVQSYERKLEQNTFLVEEIEDLKRELKKVRGYKLPKRLLLTKSTSTGDEEEDESESFSDR